MPLLLNKYDKCKAKKTCFVKKKISGLVRKNPSVKCTPAFLSIVYDISLDLIYLKLISHTKCIYKLYFHMLYNIYKSNPQHNFVF